MMFARRHRTDWDQPDTVYDAWLLRRGLEQSWFDNHTFFDIMYPELKEGELGSPSDGSDDEGLEAIPCYQQQCEEETRTSRVEKGKKAETITDLDIVPSRKGDEL